MAHRAQPVPWERQRRSPRLPLSRRDFDSILRETRLPALPPARLASLRAELERVGAVWSVHRASPAPVQPSRAARRLRSIASRAESLAKSLDTQSLVWLGHEMDLQDGYPWLSDESPRPPVTGLERAESDREAVERLADLAQRASRRWGRPTQGDPPPRRSPDTVRRDVVAALGRSFERAFRRRLGASLEGPGVRFVRAFFYVHGERPSQRTALVWVRAARSPRAAP